MDILDRLVRSCFGSWWGFGKEDGGDSKYIDYAPTRKWRYNDENLVRELGSTNASDVAQLSDDRNGQTSTNMKLRLHDNVFLNPLNQEEAAAELSQMGINRKEIIGEISPHIAQIVVVGTNTNDNNNNSNNNASNSDNNSQPAEINYEVVEGDADVTGDGVVAMEHEERPDIDENCEDDLKPTETKTDAMNIAEENEMRTENVIVEDENVILEAENVAVEDENVAVEDENVAAEVKTVGEENNNVAVEAENIPVEDENVTPEAENVAVKNEHVAEGDEHVAAEVENVSEVENVTKDENVKEVENLTEDENVNEVENLTEDEKVIEVENVTEVENLTKIENVDEVENVAEVPVDADKNEELESSKEDNEPGNESCDTSTNGNTCADAGGESVADVELNCVDESSDHYEREFTAGKENMTRMMNIMNG